MTQRNNSQVADIALIVTAFIWAINFSIVKHAITTINPMAFNTLRLIGASVILVLLSRLFPTPRFEPSDWPRCIALALIGHTGYQLLFISSISRTTASNTAILLGLTPVFVALLSASFGVEKTTPRTWLGIVISIFGVYLVLNNSLQMGGNPFGDWLALAATLMWSIYTVGGKSIVQKYGLLKSNAYLLCIGTIFFLPFGIPALVNVPFSNVPLLTWFETAFSFLFALVVAYCCWFYAVSKIGPTKTAIYSNLTPVGAIMTAHLWLGEQIGGVQIFGVFCILAGIYFVRSTQTN